MAKLGFHRRPKAQSSEINPDIRINNASDVLETIEHLEIPHDMLIVFGSSALALLGLDRQAHDVDLILHPDIINTLSDTQHLPNQTPVTEVPSRSTSFRHFKADTLPLPGDFTSYSSSYLARTFEEARQRRTVQGPNGLVLMSPGELLRAKKDPVQVADTAEKRRLKIAQNKYDAILLEQYIRSSRY